MKYLLSDILFEMDFGYKINEDLTLSLIDIQEVNLGNIESEKYKITQNLPMEIIDRLDKYIYDYFTESIIYSLINKCKHKENEIPNEEQLIELMKKNPKVFNKERI